MPTQQQKIIGVVILAGVAFLVLRQGGGSIAVRRTPQRQPSRQPTPPSIGEALGTAAKAGAIGAIGLTARQLTLEGLEKATKTIGDTVGLVQTPPQGTFGAGGATLNPTSSPASFASEGFIPSDPGGSTFLEKGLTVGAKKGVKEVTKALIQPAAVDLASAPLSITEGGGIFVETTQGPVSIEAAVNVPKTVDSPGILSPTWASLAGAAVGATVGFGLAQIEGGEVPAPVIGATAGALTAIGLGASALSVIAIPVAILGVGIQQAFFSIDRKKEAAQTGVKWAVAIKPEIQSLVGKAEQANTPAAVVALLNNLIPSFGKSLNKFLQGLPGVGQRSALLAIVSVLRPEFDRIDALIRKFGASPVVSLTQGLVTTPFGSLSVFGLQGPPSNFPEALAFIKAQRTIINVQSFGFQLPPIVILESAPNGPTAWPSQLDPFVDKETFRILAGRARERIQFVQTAEARVALSRQLIAQAKAEGKFIGEDFLSGRQLLTPQIFEELTTPQEIA